MKLKSQREFWSGLMFVGIGLGFAWAATGYDFGASAQPGLGMLPLGLGLLLALLGGLVLFKSLAIESERGEPLSPVAWRPWLLVPLAIGLFGFGLPRLGLLCTIPGVTALVVLAAAPALRPTPWRRMLLAAVLATLAACAILILGLHLALPLWPVLPA